MAELAELKKEHKQPRKQRFARLDFVVNGMYLVHIPDETIDPERLVVHVLEEVVRTQSARTRFSVRFVPIAATCHSSIETIEDTLRPILTAEFSAGIIIFLFVPTFLEATVAVVWVFFFFLTSCIRCV